MRSKTDPKVGDRFYYDNLGNGGWCTVTCVRNERHGRHLNWREDGRTRDRDNGQSVDGFARCSYVLLPGDPGCPPDPRADEGQNSFYLDLAGEVERIGSEMLAERSHGCPRFCGNTRNGEYTHARPCGNCGFPELKAVAAPVEPEGSSRQLRWDALATITRVLVDRDVAGAKRSLRSVRNHPRLKPCLDRDPTGLELFRDAIKAINAFGNHLKAVVD